MTTEALVAVYLRMSTLRDDRIEDHRASTEALRLRKGLPVGREYVDNDTSASKERKPDTAYVRLLEDVKAGLVNVIVTHDLDRFLRRVKDLEVWLELAETQSIRLLSVSDDVDTATPNGRLYLRIKVSVAQHEMEQKSARQKFANEQRVKAGERIPGVRPFGFSVKGELVPAEAEAIRDLCSHILAGGSVRKACMILDAAGLTTTKGNKWESIALKRMLANPRNAGMMYYKGDYVTQSPYGGAVSEDVWRAVNRILKDPARKTHDGMEPHSLLTGTAHCFYCRTKLVSSRTKHSRAGYKCKQGHLLQRQDLIDEFVTSQVLAQVFFTDMYLQENKQQPQPVDTTELVALRSRLEELAEDRALGLITRAQLQAGTAKVQEQIAALEAVEPVPDTSDWAGLVSSIQDRVWWAGLTLDQQRSVVRPFSILVKKSNRAGAKSTPVVTFELERDNISAHFESLRRIMRQDSKKPR